MNELFELIEEDRFMARLTIASSIRTFLRAAQRESFVRRLARMAGETAGKELFERIVHLMARLFDTAYRSPYDPAVAVYLWVLASVNEPLARACAAEVDGLQQGCWVWTAQMATMILNQNTAEEGTAVRRPLDRTCGNATNVRVFLTTQGYGFRQGSFASGQTRSPTLA